MSGTTHVIGAGIAGLSAATALAEAGQRVVVHEATRHAGGRCRSYYDRALGMQIDNGNHIILSGNSAALDYLKRIGASGRVCGPKSAEFGFFDLATGERWKVDLGNSRLPWWIFDRHKRVPATRARDYLALAPLSWRPGPGTVGDVMSCPEPLYGRLVQPVLLAALNNEPREASARLASVVLRESIVRGGRNCRPLVAMEGLSAAFVDPALRFLAKHGASIRMGHGLRAIRRSGNTAEALEFSSDTVELKPGDAVVLAVPAEAAARLVPELTTPSELRSIANIHFRLEDSVNLPVMTGVVGGLTQWLFRFPGRISVTVSNADHLAGMDRAQLACTIWSEVIRVAGVSLPLPAWQVVHEHRATFATVPEQEKRRPAPQTRWKNLILAGDWVATGLPPTIEGAVRSGRRAAQLLAAGGRLNA